MGFALHTYLAYCYAVRHVLVSTEYKDIGEQERERDVEWGKGTMHDRDREMGRERGGWRERG